MILDTGSERLLQRTSCVCIGSSQAGGDGRAAGPVYTGDGESMVPAQAVSDDASPFIETSRVFS